MMTDFSVEVTRVRTDYDNNVLSSYGVYTSRVYDIDRDANLFLVYDPGEDVGDESGILPHFCWVDFEAKCKWPNGEYCSTVILAEEASNNG